MSTNKPTVVIGASPNADRYSFRATMQLKKHGYKVFPVGIRNGKIGEEEIITEKRPFENVDTVTMYVGPANQPAWYDYVLSLHPKRIIFNPGAENEAFAKIAESKGIVTENACTLVLLSTNSY